MVRLLHRRPRGWGEADSWTSWSRSTPCRRGRRRPGAAGGYRLQLWRLHDLLPDQPHRPFRRRRRRWRGQRPVELVGTADLGHLLATASSAALPRRERTGSPYSAVQPGRNSTPTLILHGGTDERCPVGQAQQWFDPARPRRAHPAGALPRRVPPVRASGAPSHRADFNQPDRRLGQQYAGGPVATADPAEAGHWGRRLTELAELHKVPGATTGILRLDPTPATSWWRRHPGSERRPRRPTTRLPVPDRLDQQGRGPPRRHATGGRGQARAGTPVIEVLPELRLATRRAQQVTMRHLLTHTSGIDGDVFTDTGRGDDCLERYVALLAEAARATRSVPPSPTATPAS